MGNSDFGCLFKAVVIIALVGGLFVFLVLKSNALETSEEKYMHNGMPYTRTNWHFHVDRLTDYVKSIPDRLGR